MGGEGPSEDAAYSMIRERLTRLQARGWIEIAALPEESTEDVMVEGLQAYVNTYVEVPEQDRRRVVVELCVYGDPVLRIFRPRRCFLDGFEMRAGGDTRPLRDDEMEKYQ